jgi:hypothetical protein
VAFDPQGGVLASGSADNTVNLWDARKGELIRRIENFPASVGSVAFDPQGGMLASGGESTDADWRFTDAEMLTAVGHLENYGYVKRLRTSKGEQRVLLQPERLNNLASSFVLEARRNPKGLGALEEKRLLASGYDSPELKDLHEGERDVLLDSAALLFLEHNVCFRETDPLRMEPYLVFPELINLKKPPEEEQATEVCWGPRIRSERCCRSCSRARSPSLFRLSCAAGSTATSAWRTPTSRRRSI